jgi:hypothetical protein
LITRDLNTILQIKKKMRTTDFKTLDAECMKHCRFLFDNYTNIYNKLLKGQIDLKIFYQFLHYLKKIEDGELSFYDASYQIGCLLKQLYVDPLVETIEKGEKTEKRERVGNVNISWNEPENIGESPIQNYIIESSYNNGAWTPIQTITSSQRSANLLGLSGTISKYVFRVAGINVSGKGGFSIATPAPRRNQDCKNSIYYHINDNINENSDVYTMGDYIAAYNIGDNDSVTINGVIFNGSNPPNNCIEGADGLVCLNITTTGSLKNENSLSTNVLPFSGLSTEYKTLLSSAVSSSATNLVLEITGLETGSQYLVQLWSNVSKQSDDISFGITQVTGLDIYGGNISLDLYHNLNYIEGGLGKSLIGTFNSCGTKLKLNLQGLDGLPPVANAIQIRKITTVACCRSSSALCTLHSPSTAVEECCEYDSYQGEYDCNGFRIMANCWMCPSFYG